MLEFIQHIINGLSTGSIYALIALGYTMVFGVLQLINFAHSDVFMLGAFISFYFSNYFRLAANPSVFALVAALLSAMVGCAAIGYIIERFAYRPLRGAPRINLLITAIGVSLFLEYSGQQVFGSSPQFYPQIFKPEINLGVGSLSINPLQVVVLSISIVLMLILQFVIFKKRVGRAMRAVSFNHDLASLMGIPTNKIISLTFMLGSALAGAAGVLVGLIYPKIDPLMGVVLGLKCFVSAVLGGIGSILGAVVGAITLGISEAFLVGYGNPSYRDALAFGILIVILLFKPSGLFGENRIEKV